MANQTQEILGDAQPVRNCTFYPILHLWLMPAPASRSCPFSSLHCANSASVDAVDHAQVPSGSPCSKRVSNKGNEISKKTERSSEGGELVDSILDLIDSHCGQNLCLWSPRASANEAVSWLGATKK